MVHGEDSHEDGVQKSELGTHTYTHMYVYTHILYIYVYIYICINYQEGRRIRIHGGQMP